MMPDDVDLTITIHVGQRSRRLPLVALAAALHLARDPLRLTLAGLVFALPGGGDSSPTPGEPTEGAERSTTSGTSEEKEEPIGSVDRSTTAGVRAQEAARPNAHYVAELLDDLPNVAALEHLLLNVPTAVLIAALDETLAVPTNRIRRTRAAYFTAAVYRRLSSGRAATSS